jgi:hypothetical protein
MLDDLMENPISLGLYLAAFGTAIQRQLRLHRNNILIAPDRWKQILKHKYTKGFIEAARIKYSTLISQTMWTEVTQEQLNSTIFLLVRWVFIYKYDNNNYITGFKARLVIRRDLQIQRLQDIYTAILATRIFRYLIAIIIYFDLDISQLDAINTFTNITLDEMVYYRILEGFHVLGKYLLLNKALYSLARAPRFWFKNLSSIFLSISFKQIPDTPCLFTSRVIIVFFYIDDIAVLNRKKNKTIAKKFKADLYQKYKLKDKEKLK